MDEKKNELITQVKQLGVLTTIPVLLLAGPAAGYFLGRWIDLKFRFYPWGTILFLILGFVASGREIFRLLKEIWKDKE